MHKVSSWTIVPSLHPNFLCMLSERYSGVEPGMRVGCYQGLWCMLDFQTKVLKGYIPDRSVYHSFTFKNTVECCSVNALVFSSLQTLSGTIVDQRFHLLNSYSNQADIPHLKTARHSLVFWQLSLGGTCSFTFICAALVSLELYN